MCLTVIVSLDRSCIPFSCSWMTLFKIINGYMHLNYHRIKWNDISDLKMVTHRKWILYLFEKQWTIKLWWKLKSIENNCFSRTTWTIASNIRQLFSLQSTVREYYTNNGAIDDDSWSVFYEYWNTVIQGFNFRSTIYYSRELL